MLSEREKLERDILICIRDGAQPLGCGTLSRQLQNLGHNISEATVGRLLREMDDLGLTRRAGFQGRLLSEGGLDRLAELDTKQRSREWGEELVKALQGRTKEQLLEALVARRGIEGEIAFLAAAHRTPDEAQQLAEMLGRQHAAQEEEGAVARADVEFHSLIAQMARNGILAAAMMLIRQDDQLAPVLEFIRRHVHRLGHEDHQRLADAIMAGQPDRAREVMIEHINNLIRDVETYWQSVGDPEQAI